MVTPSAGAVILVRFPFSVLLSQSCGQPLFWCTLGETNTLHRNL